jgi:hypothetical protein
MSLSRLSLPTMIASWVMLLPSLAHAAVSVQGTPEIVHIEAHNASIEEVLRALGDAYGLSYKSNVPLGKKVSGTYDGPLSRVLARLLQESNFVLTHNGKTFQIVIISPGGPKAILSPSKLSATPIAQASSASELASSLFPPPGPTTPSMRK